MHAAQVAEAVLLVTHHQAAEGAQPGEEALQATILGLGADVRRGFVNTGLLLTAS